MDIKKIVRKLVKKHGCLDPFKLAAALDVTILYKPLGNTLGFFVRYKRQKVIVLNESCPESLLPFVMAHELGHAVLHPKVNTPFLKGHTLFSVDKIEREANTFAVELLLPDELLINQECCISSVARCQGIPDGMELLKIYSERK
ncbi:ImmA/IrrE family metallo-endopeptidase [Veillonella sp.]|uniref:ImmA/IrrE family metallo-endopeptidase n=1 Tax=Veillonella sp. TaxID=1926307 RepID=UPI0025F94B1D|nr:ImmA/IrrE family metallo-endopeptidase [Veillonella sp.]